MKKKKFLLVFATLTAPCILATGALVGCGEQHEHAYTKWENSETQHWLVCPDDNEKDENSVADHEFGTDGKCVECGYEKPHTHAYTKWRTSETEHWKVCPDDNTEGPGTRAPHNYVNGECECGRRDSFSGEVSVGEKFNGKTLTLKKDGQSDVALTVTDGKVTLTNMKYGEWTAICEIFGATVKTTVTVDEGISELDLSGFTSGTAKINMTDGSFTWHRQGHETAKMNLAEEASGDQFVALKIATAPDFFDWTTKTDEMRFGVAMTVNGAEHIINFNWRNWERTNIGFSSDVKNWQTENQDKDMGEVNYRGYDAVVAHLFKPNFQGWDDKEKGWGFGTYGGAIIEDGVYFIYQYEAATGKVNVYLSDGETYILVYTEEEMFEKNGKFTAFGITEGETDTKWAGGSHNSGIDRDFTFTIGYGTTVNAAVGDEVSEWQATLNITGNKADFDGADVVANKTSYSYGETATITVTVPVNKIATVTVDDGTPVTLEETGNITVKTINHLHTVNVVFASDKFSGEVAVDEAFNGKTLTLKKEGQTDVVLTVADGKVTLTNVKLGEWTAICNLLGATIKGTVTLTDGMTELDLSGLVSGTADMDLDTGAFVYTSKKDDAPTVGVELAEAKSGDAYVRLKMSTDCTLEDITNKYEELHLGVWMTVGDSKHWVELHWRNWQARSFGIHTDQDHGNANGTDTLKDLLWKPTFEGDGNDNYSSYGDGNHNWELSPFGEAFLGDGIYLIMRYESATGNVDVLLAKSDGYVKVCTFEKMFAANGEVKAFGIGTTDGSWDFHQTPGGFKIDCELNYGATLGAAINDGASDWKSTVNITGNKDEVDGAEVAANKTAYEYGETATITVTVPVNKIATVVVDGGAPVVLEETGDITINAINKSQHTVNVVFANDKFTGEVAVDEAFNGKTFTLKKDGQTDVVLTVANGKVTFTNVKLGEWTATCELFGKTVKCAVTLTDGMTELDLPGLVTGTADINIDTGAFVYQQKGDESPNVDVNLAAGVSGDSYVSLKMSTDTAKDGWTTNYEELHLGLWMTVGGTKHWIELHWHNWDVTHFGIHSDTDHGTNNGADVLKANLWEPIAHDDFYNNPGWKMMPYGEAFTGNGMYLVMKYDSATGNVDVLLAKSDAYVKVCTFEGMFEAGQQLTAFGVGKVGTDDYNIHNCPGGLKIDCVLNYGTTLGNATGENITETPVTP